MSLRSGRGPLHAGRPPFSGGWRPTRGRRKIAQASCVAGALAVAAVIALPAGGAAATARARAGRPAGRVLVSLGRLEPAHGGGWSQTAGTYRIYVGDSSALAGLPLRGAFRIASTPAARQVVVRAPSTMRPGRVARVRVRLTASGTETLHGVRLALQVPQGWMVKPVGPIVFGPVPPSEAPTSTFMVRPPSYAPNTNAVVHATAQLGPAATREAGVSVTVGG